MLCTSLVVIIGGNLDVGFPLIQHWHACNKHAKLKTAAVNYHMRLADNYCIKLSTYIIIGYIQVTVSKLIISACMHKSN